MGKHKQIWLFVICCFQILPWLKAEPLPASPLVFASHTYHTLYTRLQDFSPQTVFCDTIRENKSVFIIHYMEIIRQDLSYPVQVVQYPPENVFHVGFPFFPENSPVRPDTVQHFLERYFLELLLNHRPQELLNQDHLLLTYNNAIYGTLSFQNLGTIIPKMIRADEYTLYTINNTLMAEWISGTDTVCCRFPRNLQLISGFDTRELEDRLTFMLFGMDNRTVKPSEQKMIKSANLSPVLFRKKGEEFFPGLSRDRFYDVSTSDTTLIYHPDYPAESLQNILIHPTPSPSRPKVNLTIQTYEPKTDTVNYEHLISFFNQDHIIYAGMERKTNGVYTWLVLAHNPDYQYLHLITLDIPVDYMNSTAVWRGKLYPYIRQDNVMDIFSTIRKTSEMQPVRIHIK